jgi:hypothetical protein
MILLPSFRRWRATTTPPSHRPAGSPPGRGRAASSLRSGLLVGRCSQSRPPRASVSWWSGPGWALGERASLPPRAAPRRHPLLWRTLKGGQLRAAVAVPSLSRKASAIASVRYGNSRKERIAYNRDCPRAPSAWWSAGPAAVSPTGENERCLDKAVVRRTTDSSSHYHPPNFGLCTSGPVNRAHPTAAAI